jgi:hypothetical protein
MNERDFEKLLESMKDAPEMGAGFETQKLWDRFAEENDFPKNNETVDYGFRDYLEFYVFQFSHTMIKPLAVSMAVFLLLLGGFASANSSSFNALPGEPMYQVKLSLEKFQLATAFSPEQKAKLQVEFTSRRLEEMVALTATAYKDNAVAVRIAMQQFKKEVENIQSDLKQEDASSSQTELAKEVGRKTKAYQETVADSIENLPDDVKQETDVVQQILKDTQDEAVEVIITAHEATDDEAVARELEKTFEQEVATLQAKDLTLEQKQKIETAILLQKEGAYRRAFQLLKEIVVE